MRRFLDFSILVLLLLIVGAQRLQAGGGPESVCVVVNAQSWASKAIANEYIKLRGIPGSNIVYLNGILNIEEITVDQFRQTILNPVLQTLQSRGLGGQIDYVVYSADFPWRINHKADAGTNKIPKLFSNYSSLTGMTFLYQLVMAKKHEIYLNLDSNWYARKHMPRKQDTSWSEGEQAELEVMNDLLVGRQKRIVESLDAFKKKLKEEGREYKEGMTVPTTEADRKADQDMWVKADILLDSLREKHPNASNVLYNAACAKAMLGKPEEAMKCLRSSYEAGWLGFKQSQHAEKDADLASLSKREDFKELIREMALPEFIVPEPFGFRSVYGFVQNGAVVKPDKGLRYILSTMLGITSGRGNSVSEVIGYLRRSAAADGTRPEGAVYVMRNWNVRSTERQWAFRMLVESLKALKIKAEMINGVVPEGKPDVMGAVIGTIHIDWKKTGSTMLPGAICEHLTSTGGDMRINGGQTPFTEFLRHGAAGSSGTVTEPYAIQAKFPSPLMHYYYARGCSLAEAFYLSVTGPYQLLIAGDPLCQPWAQIPAVAIEGLEEGAEVSGVLRLTPKADAGPGRSISHLEIYWNGIRSELSQPGKDITIDTAQLPDGWHTLGIAASVADGIQTRGRKLIRFRINNTDRELAMIPLKNDQIPLDAQIRFELACKGAKEIIVSHNLRILGMIPGEAGKVDIPAADLGLGPVTLRLGAQFADGSRVYGKDVSLTIIPPAAYSPVEPMQANYTPGILLRKKDGPACSIPVIRPDLLSKTGIKKGDSFELIARFGIETDDMYQFRLRTPVKIKSFKLDGKDLGITDARIWQTLPVHLAKGEHKLVIEGRVKNRLALDLLFGGPGLWPLAAPRFQHVAVGGERIIEDPRKKKKNKE